MTIYVTSFRALGSQANIWLDTTSDGTAALQQVPGWLETVEAALSRFRPTSELSRLNLRPGEWMPASALLLHALEAALTAARITGGRVTPLVYHALVAAGYDRSFEMMRSTDYVAIPDAPIQTHHWQEIAIDRAAGRIWLPDAIDLGGTAKGWAACQVAERLAPFGPVLVDLGGDIVARGRVWAVNVADPYHADNAFCTLALANRAVATSGTDYRRWGKDRHHIIDPRTGAPARTDVVSATVIHPDAVLAEALAKAVVLKGSIPGLHWLGQQADAAGLVFDREGRVLATENFRSYITESSPFKTGKGA